MRNTGKSGKGKERSMWLFMGNNRAGRIPENEKSMELNQSDIEQIAEQITRGFTSGVIDGEEEGDNEKNGMVSVRISWKLDVEKFEL